MGLRTGGRRAKSLKNRVKSSKIELRFREVRSEGCTSCTPVLQALIIFQYALLRLCFGRAVFVAPFPENWGARLRISGGCPARGEPEALINPCSSIACRAQPCQRCSPVLQALIISQYATLRLCFGRAVFCWLYLATVEPLHSNLCRGSVTFYFSFRSFSR